MGFDKDFIQTGKVCVENDLECPICLELLENPVDLKGCQHTFCNDCICPMWGICPLSCPLCRHDIKDTSDIVPTHRFLRNTLSKIQLKCSHGCGKIFSHENYREHIRSCDDNPENFIECACKSKFPKYEFLAHKDSCMAYLQKKLVSLI